AVVAIFLPVIFMKGVIGRYLYQYGITVSVAVCLSLLEALTLTPMRCSRFLRVSHVAGSFAGRVDRFFHRLAGVYRGVIEVLLRHRWTTVGGALILFALSLMLAKKLPSEMMPPQDQGQILLRMKGPVNAALPMTDSRSQAAEEYLMKLPEVD